MIFSFKPGKLLWVPEPSHLWPQTEKYEQVPRLPCNHKLNRTDNPVCPASQGKPLPSADPDPTALANPPPSCTYSALRSSSKKSNPDTHQRDGFQLSFRDVSACLQINVIGGLLVHDAEASATTLHQVTPWPHGEWLRDNEMLCPRAFQN